MPKKSQPPEGDAKEGKRPVLTVTLPRERMEALDNLAGLLKSISEKLPSDSWVKVPTTRGGVASWLIERALLDAYEKTLAVLFERDENVFNAQPENRDQKIEMPNNWGEENIAGFREKIKEINSSDPFFQIIRLMLRVK